MPVQFGTYKHQCLPLFVESVARMAHNWRNAAASLKSSADVSFQSMCRSFQKSLKLREELNDKVGIATVDLPTNENTLNLNLSISKQNQSTTINLGSIKIDSGTSNIYPPYIRKAIAVNYPSYTDFQIDGKQFGVRRFGKENTSIQVVPTSTVITNNNLRRRLSRQQLVPTNCIPYGSYVNIAHPAGTTTKKITVIHSCNR